MKASKFSEAQIAFVLRQAEEGTAIGEATFWRKIRVLTMVDTFTRFAPAIEPRFSFKAADVVEVLERVGREHGFLKAIRVDQGTEFVSRDLDLWAYQRGVTLDFSRPGKPTDNAFIESLNGKFRAECLNAHWFMSLDDARAKCEAWFGGVLSACRRRQQTAATTIGAAGC